MTTCGDADKNMDNPTVSVTGNLIRSCFSHKENGVFKRKGQEKEGKGETHAELPLKHPAAGTLCGKTMSTGTVPRLSCDGDAATLSEAGAKPLGLKTQQMLP